MVLGLAAAFCVSPTLGAIVLFCIAVYYGISGVRALTSDEPSFALFSSNAGKTAGQPAIPQTSSAPLTNAPTLAEKMKSMNIPRDIKCPSCGAVIMPADRKCNYCGSALVPLVDLPKPYYFNDVQVGQSVRVNHPRKGKLDLKVRARLYYGELWQEKMRADVPWTLTGNYFVGLLLADNLYLLNWQKRFYLLESSTPITDMDINRDFAQPARKFAASNQTANVTFPYAGTDWHMDDIGRFRIEYNEGDDLNATPGAVGRFIHASKDNLALVMEDYQSGGSGQDTVRQGFLLNEKDIEF